MRLVHKILMLAVLLSLSWSSAMASFCTTYAGTGDCVTLTGMSVNHIALAASAVFEVNSGKLGITLVNDAASSASTLGGAEVLTAVLFNLSSAAGSLTPTGSSASLNAPLIGLASLTTPSSDSVSQNWALANSSNYFANQYSVTATGLSGPSGGKANLGGCTSSGSTACRVLDGPPWGIIPAANAGGNAGGLNPLINHYVFFTLAGLTSNLTNSQLKADLSNVVFQYGTGVTDSTCLGCGHGTGNPVPEPSHIAFLIISSALVVYLHQRKQRLA